MIARNAYVPVVVCVLCLAVCASLATPDIYVPNRWNVFTHRPAPQTIEICRGETVSIEPVYLTYGNSAVTLSNVTSVALRYWTSDMTNGTYYSQTGTVTDASAGKVAIVWGPTNEVTASSASYAVVLSGSSTASMKAYGTLKLTGPDWLAPTNNPLQQGTVDWSGLTHENLGDAPFPQTADLTAVSNRVTAVEAGTNTWNTAYGWGDHAGAGYATGTPVYAESDPVFGASIAAGIAAQDIINWDAAYGWGDHSGGGYLTSYAETDPNWAAVSNTVTTGAALGATALQAESDTWGDAMLRGNTSSVPSAVFSTQLGRLYSVYATEPRAIQIGQTITDPRVTVCDYDAATGLEPVLIWPGGQAPVVGYKQAVTVSIPTNGYFVIVQTAGDGTPTPSAYVDGQTRDWHFQTHALREVSAVVSSTNASTQIYFDGTGWVMAVNGTNILVRVN